MTHLPDTNAWIAYLRGKNTTLLARLKAHAPSDLGLSTVVLGELYYGACHSGAANVAANLQLVDQLTHTFPVVGFGPFDAREYGKLREYLGSQGLLIGPNDLLIAPTALANGLILVTHNTAEFSRVPGLTLEDWQLP
ncbi:MAG: type II toxin-antitoxin system VapC family toxin [Gemmataceae bacterium]